MTAVKTKTYFIDSNIFLRVLIKEDSKSFQECLRILKLVRENQISAATSTLVLAEIGWTLKSFYKTPKNKITEMIESIVNLRGLKIVDQFDPNLALEFFRRFNIKLIDAFIASLKPIAEKKWVIVSYDKDFQKLPILATLPSSINPQELK